jgi:hypothetical protein
MQLSEQYNALKVERDGLEMDLACDGGSPDADTADIEEGKHHDDMCEDGGDGDTVASGHIMHLPQQSPLHPEEASAVRKVGRPSSKGIAARRRSSRN